MMSGRLTLTGAFNRRSHFEDASFSSTNSASQAQLERELKEVKQRNVKLAAQLEETRSTLAMLMKQSSYENFDERRVNLLKCQLIQQERQIMLLKEALGSRSSVITEVENAMSWLAETLRNRLSSDLRSTSLSITKGDVEQMIETTESARIKLFKNIENTTAHNLAKPLMFMNNFIRSESGQECTLFDIISGKVDHINLKQVAHLESKLSSLYKELIRLNYIIVDEKSANQSLSSSHMTSAIKERLNTQVLLACAMLKDCSDDLLTLSLLYPSAPWPILKRPVVKEVSVEKIMSALPPLPRSKSQDVQRIVAALIKVYNYKHHMLDREVCSLREEVKFHQSVYHVQMNYTTCLFDALRDGCGEFEQQSTEIIVKPMKEVLDAYLELKSTAEEDALRNFLTTFKENEQLFSEAVNKLGYQKDHKDELHSVLTAFGKEFMAAVDFVVADRQKIRDREVTDMRDVREEQERLDNQLRTLLDKIEFEKSCPEKSENDNGSVKNDSLRSVNSCMRKSKSDIDINKQSNKYNSLSPIMNRRERKSRSGIESKSRSDTSKPDHLESDRSDIHEEMDNVQSRLEISVSDSSTDLQQRPRSRARPPAYEPNKSDNCVFQGESENVKSRLGTYLSDSSSDVQRPRSRARRPASVAAEVEGSSEKIKPSYKPKMYIAQQTLKLRRNDSLTCLSDDDVASVYRTELTNGEDAFLNGEHFSSGSKIDLPKVSTLSGRKPPFK